MRKVTKSLVVIMLVAAMVLSTACGKKNDAPATPTSAPSQGTDTTQQPTDTTTPAGTDTTAPSDGDTTTVDPVEKYWCDEFDVMTLDKYEYGKDYTALYEQVGKDITIDDVIEDPDTGFGYINVDGELHLLGLDFLTMAMVYNNTPCGDYKTEDDVYAAWWRLYITRWNYLLPEVPLYSNEYYDLYNAQIEGVTQFPTNPYWDPSDALIDWTSTKEDQSIIIGNSTELSGQFRYASYGKSSPGASDLDIEELTSGLETVSKNKAGGYEWNKNVVAAHSEEVDAEGNKTFTITIKDDLVFSDGSPVTAKDYLANSLAFFSPVGTQASGREMAGKTVLGCETGYHLYTGPGSTEGTKALKGLRLLDQYTFAVTVPADYIPYFYDITYASFGPSYSAMWIGDADIMDDGEGCYLSDSFYEKDADGNYKMAAAINDICTNTSAEAYARFPYSGPYCVESFDTTDSTAVLVKNPYFKGNYEGVQPKIEKIVYKRVVSATQLEDFKAGGLDVISGITGGPATDEALALADGSDGKYVYTHYSRAGYGKLGFRADFGPVQFTEVRQAIAFCMNRGKFAKDFTGGYGGVVDGPYYSGSWMYKAAVAQGMLLNTYATSADSAIEVLEQAGWVYDANGEAYTSGVRYKKIPGDIINEKDKNFQSVDGAYKTTEVNGDYYMPLVINWYGTADNEFTDLLQTGFKVNDNVAAAGMVVYNTIGDFAPMLDELYQAAVYGYYAGTPMYGAFNFATGFNSAVYDFAFNMTIDPSMYDDYSQYYIKDSADIFWLNK